MYGLSGLGWSPLEGAKWILVGAIGWVVAILVAQALVYAVAGGAESGEAVARTTVVSVVITFLVGAGVCWLARGGGWGLIASFCGPQVGVWSPVGASWREAGMFAALGRSDAAAAAIALGLIGLMGGAVALIGRRRTGDDDWREPGE